MYSIFHCWTCWFGFLCQEPLNSGDDVSDEEDNELFDTENVVVCQYDKVRNDLFGAQQISTCMIPYQFTI